ncbi:hypothetical protein M5D96_002887 [Drosophila gunungcola]|uniref:Uncharacterized protein n=1 Tax=Drosophila gunungcola TaxID=103775 RepID=A0A9P9Z0W3_9MUSC|nr:hypothetical protein M5D96_002887 [Drosophila gunungcola]
MFGHWGIRGLEDGRMGGAMTNRLAAGKISKSHGLPQHLTHPATLPPFHPGQVQVKKSMRRQRNVCVWSFSRKMRHKNKMETEAEQLKRRPNSRTPQ